MAARLDAVGEEVLLSLMREGEERADRRRLRIAAFPGNGGAVLEFVVAPRGENLEDRLALLGDPADEGPVEHEVSLRLLRHLASSVRHQQYHDTDILTVHVKDTASGAKA